MFKSNFRAKMAELGMSAKDVANSMEKAGYTFEAKEPYRIVQSWVQKQAYLPNVISGYAIARALETTVEELVDGEAGAEYVRKIVRNDPRAVQVPDRIFPIVKDLLLLDDKELRAIRANVEELAADKKGRAMEAAG